MIPEFPDWVNFTKRHQTPVSPLEIVLIMVDY